MKIRALCPEDWETFRRMMCRLHRIHAEKRPDIFRVDADPFPEEEFQSLLGCAGKIAFAAEQDGMLAGFCIMELKEASHPVLRKRTVAVVEDLYVEDAYRRRGIGRKLFEQAVSLARRRGAESMQLKVWSFNQSAVDFYRSMGMKVQNMTMEECFQ